MLFAQLCFNWSYLSRSTLNCDLFEALDSWVPMLQNHIWFVPTNLLEVVSIFTQIIRHCATMLFTQPCFNRSYFSRFNYELWYAQNIEFLTSEDLKSYVACPKKHMEDSPDFELKLMMRTSIDTIWDPTNSIGIIAQER